MRSPATLGRPPGRNAPDQKVGLWAIEFNPPLLPELGENTTDTSQTWFKIDGFSANG